jgi:signal transduction histidine kinase
LVTISENNKPVFRAHASAQLRYAITFVSITLIVLIILNIYCASANEQLFYENKKTSLTAKATLTAKEIALTGYVGSSSASNVISRTARDMKRVMVTTDSGEILYDTFGMFEQTQPLPPEIDQAITGEAAFAWDYSSGVMTAAIAVPIYIDEGVVGCVYMVEVDTRDGMLLRSMQLNILTITLVLGAFLLLFSIFYVRRYTNRLNKIMASMRVIQEGDFSQKIDMRGSDELRFLADEFNYLTEKLQISENKRRQFVSDASHELKTPLASIKLLSDSILQYDMDMETVREFAGDIGDEAERLNRMTLKLLALTKDEGNTAVDEAEIIFMTPTIERVVKMLQNIAQNSRIHIHLDLADDVPVLVQEDDLYQITFNLVENGIKYNIPGGDLYINLQRQEDMAVLSVTDTGVGIPPESIGHVFERFYRVDKARSRQSGGSGLGLAIVRAMVERNSGEIQLTSTVGKGTTFTVAFPCFDIDESEITPDEMSEELQ